MRTFWRFAFQERRLEFKAWERLLPNTVWRPVITSFAKMLTSLLIRQLRIFH
jgi:hypothetical protein